MKFEGKVCIVTGGALGIGRCLTEAFAGEGAKIAFLDFNREAGTDQERRLAALGTDVLFVPGDVGVKGDLDAFRAAVAERFGRVDILINNACLSKKGILSGCSYEDFQYVLAVGVTAPYYLTTSLLPYFAENASVINISSTRAFSSQPDTESYTAAKGGILSLTHALAVSLAGRARVNAISPGWIDTGAYHRDGYRPAYSEGDLLQHPSQRVGDPTDIARAALFLADPQNSFINGENLTVDGGMERLMIYHDDCGWSYRPER